MNECANCANKRCPFYGRKDIEMMIKCPDKVKRRETKEEAIHRLNESHNLLYRSMMKYGCYTKCHDELFRKIRENIEYLESPYPRQPCFGKEFKPDGVVCEHCAERKFCKDEMRLKNDTIADLPFP